MPAATPTAYDRCLSEAGLRPEPGRGRGTSIVTVRDAAHLLAAVLASPLVKDSVHSVERYVHAACRRREIASVPYIDRPEVENLRPMGRPLSLDECRRL